LGEKDGIDIDDDDFDDLDLLRVLDFAVPEVSLVLELVSIQQVAMEGETSLALGMDEVLVAVDVDSASLSSTSTSGASALLVGAPGHGLEDFKIFLDDDDDDLNSSFESLIAFWRGFFIDMMEESVLELELVVSFELMELGVAVLVLVLVLEVALAHSLSRCRGTCSWSWSWSRAFAELCCKKSD